MSKLLILGGPFTGKTTAHKEGLGYDPETNPEYEDAKQAAGTGDQSLWKLYDKVLLDAINSDEEVVFGHFGDDAYRAGLAAGREVRIVVTEAEELRKRVNRWNKSNASRTAAAMHQLSNLVHWLNTDGKWLNPKVYNNLDAALSNK